LTWEQQRQLIEDGHVLLVRDYLVEKGLKLPTGLEELAAAEEAAVAAAGARQGGSGSPRAPKPLRPLHPSIPQVDLDALWKRLVEPIGSEKPNLHVRTISLPAHASAKQIAAHEQTYLFDEVLGQDVHKASLLARRQKQAVDVTPGAGRTRYQKGARYSIQSDDKAGTGFWYDAVYEVLLDQNGKHLSGLDGRGAAARRSHQGWVCACARVAQELWPDDARPIECAKTRCGGVQCDR
jgi:hypothetical protein